MFEKSVTGKIWESTWVLFPHAPSQWLMAVLAHVILSYLRIPGGWWSAELDDNCRRSWDLNEVTQKDTYSNACIGILMDILYAGICTASFPSYFRVMRINDPGLSSYFHVHASLTPKPKKVDLGHQRSSSEAVGPSHQSKVSLTTWPALDSVEETPLLQVPSSVYLY